MNDKDKPFKHVLIIGCGDIGQRVAKIWQKTGIAVSGLARNESSLKMLKHLKINAYQANLDSLNGLNELPSKHSLLYYFAPPPTEGSEDSRMTNFLKNLDKNALPDHFIYISTSGIYGDQQGKLTTEKTPVNPKADRAKRRYNAEQQLNVWSSNNHVPITILRVAGIYGPGRLPLQRIKNQIPMLYENLAPQTNRIHADDLAQICVAAATKNAAGEIYNVSDGTNSNMTDYFNTIADFFNLPRPPLVDWNEAEKTISKGMLSYLKESRKIDNSKMINELKVKLKYPNLNDGLKSCID